MASPQTWSSPINTTTDANFRIWGAEFKTKAALCGLVQTADTGQVNWTTATRAGSATTPYYEIWRFVDSTIYMKIETQCTATSNCQMWATFGTGSDGAGNITGSVSTRQTFSASSNSSDTVSYVSYMSRTADYFGFCWKLDGYSANYILGLMTVGKSVNGSGVATTQGYASVRILSPGQSPQFETVAFSPYTLFNNTNIGYCAIPGQPTSSITAAGAFQAYEWWMNIPDVQPYIWNSAVIITEVPRAITFQCAMAGTTLRTYLSLGSASQALSGYPTGTYVITMLYE